MFQKPVWPACQAAKGEEERENLEVQDACAETPFHLHFALATQAKARAAFGEDI